MGGIGPINPSAVAEVPYIGAIDPVLCQIGYTLGSATMFWARFRVNRPVVVTVWLKDV